MAAGDDMSGGCISCASSAGVSTSGVSGRGRPMPDHLSSTPRPATPCRRRPTTFPRLGCIMPHLLRRRSTSRQAFPSGLALITAEHLTSSASD